MSDGEAEAHQRTPEEEETLIIKGEILRGIEAVSLLDTDVDPTPYLSIICAEGPDPYWRPTFCTVCDKPKISHTALTGACRRIKISQTLKTKYETTCKSNKTMETAAHTQAAKIRAANFGTPNSGAAGSKYDNRTELAEWGKDESWESYKRVLEMYDKACEKKPVGKFNDLVTALKKSGRTDITDRLLQDMMADAGATDVISRAISWLGARYGKTPTEEFILAWRSYRTALRRKDEGIADYVNRFEDVTRRLESH